jgi:hypothetical protein
MAERKKRKEKREREKEKSRHAVSNNLVVNTTFLRLWARILAKRVARAN